MSEVQASEIFKLCGCSPKTPRKMKDARQQEEYVDRGVKKAIFLFIAFFFYFLPFLAGETDDDDEVDSAQSRYGTQERLSHRGVCLCILIWCVREGDGERTDSAHRMATPFTRRTTEGHSQIEERRIGGWSIAACIVEWNTCAQK